MGKPQGPIKAKPAWDKRAAIEKSRTKHLNQLSKLKKLRARLEAQGRAKPLEIKDNVEALERELLGSNSQAPQQQQQQQQQEDAAFGERIREVIGQFSSQGKGLTQSQMMQVLQALAEQQEQQPPPAPRNPSLPQNRSSLPNPSQAQAIQQQLGVAKGMAGRQLSGCQVEDLRGLRPSPAASRAHSDPQVQLPDNWAAAPPTPTQQQQVQQQQQPQLPQLPEELRASLLAQQLQALQVAQQGLQAPQTSQAPHRPYARSSQSAPGNQFIPMPRPSMKLLASMQQQQQQQQLQSSSHSLVAIDKGVGCQAPVVAMSPPRTMQSSKRGNHIRNGSRQQGRMSS
uniref:Uncharacterized protein n=1 Tax=Dunaliella tertiolecta TaxID=3047 RepID=A0A7S3R035_DUNTE